MSRRGPATSVLLLLLACLVAACSGLPHGARIVNGSDASIEAYPWMAVIQYKDSIKCSGTVISDSWVLTNAACVQKFKPTDYWVLVGMADRTSGGLLYNVSQTAYNHKFSSKKRDYDVGAVQVDGTFTFTDTLQPISLATEAPADGALVTAMGWGTLWNGGYPAEVLQAVDLYVVNWDECSQADVYSGKLTERMFCAGWPGGGKGTCGRDKGGPAVLDGVQVGIASWSNGCAMPGYPSIFTSIVQVRDWITETTGV